MKSLNEIIDLIELHGLTAYEISKDVPLSEQGLLKLFKGESKPRESTLAILSEYLEKKYPTNVVISEPEPKPYNIDLANERSKDIGNRYSRYEVINHIEDNWREYLEVPAFKKLVKAWVKRLDYEPELLKEIREIKTRLSRIEQNKQD